MIPFSFQKGNKTSGCEDAPPIATPSYSIVCDGLGGSGATKHSIMEGDNKTPIMRTSGYLGSRIVCDCVNEYYAQNLDELASAIRTQDHSSLLNTFLSGLKNKIETAFDEKMKEWGIEASKSNTLKDFPTTLASSIYMPHSNGITVLAVWAGDSRVYVLEPEKGLRLLSLDDA
ncbi:MAG: protein phosphatase 2C domain-containing protein, partial [Oscillospiraceae bacterium]|nr:protein phosphatase 2C domain-containing protein [Oscillospiraceae bacterium]